MTVNPRDFLLNTDYEMDKIVLFKSGSLTSTKDITHDLGYAPLAFGVWSTDSNFSSVNAIGKQDYSLGPPGSYTPYLCMTCKSYSDKITLAATGNSGGTTLYYRLYAFEPSDVAQNAPATSGDSNTLIFNSDYNYSKLLATGVFTANNQEYAHNLGYIPQVMAWERVVAFSLNYITPTEGGNTTGLKVSVTNNKIKVTGLDTSVIDKVYWRIYYDQA